MQIVSAEYKAEQKRDLRNESHVFVYLGVISKEAQASAYVDTELEPYASGDIFTETHFEAYYATLETNLSKVDSSMYFLPENPSMYALFQGAVTTDIEGAITFEFDGYHELQIKGLTIDFGEYYPTEFTVTNGNNTYTYTNDTAGTFVLEDVFNNTDYITITPVTMVGDQQRMRILSMIFGVGLLFDNSTLISTQRTNTVDHLSNTLPKKQFSFTVSNIGKKFNVDNPNSFINFLQVGQECSFDYGRTMDDETIYRFEGGNVSLKTWSSNDTQAKFTCVGYMDAMTDTYIRGQYRPTAVTLYSLAEEVLADAGIENYRLDSHLKRVSTSNPLPVTTHKNCLQLIANAGQCILYEDRSGKIILESTILPEVMWINYTLGVQTSAEPYSSQKIYDGKTDDDLYTKEKGENYYATLEVDFTKVDGTLKFLPESGLARDYLPKTGYVSKEVAQSNGSFSSDTGFKIYYPNQWTMYGIILEYAPWTAPEEVTLIGYVEQEEVARLTTTEVHDIPLIFEECDTIEIQFTKNKPGQRVHVNSVKVGDVTDYEITYHDLSATPVATSTEMVKDIDVHYYKYSYGTETETAATVEAASGENTVTFSQPYYNYQLAFKETTGTLTIVESGAYYIIFQSSKDATVEITAKKIDITDKSYIYNVNELGITKTVQNTLIDNAVKAEAEGEWVGEYYSSDVEYSITFRGEPALDCDDLIYLENKFIPKNLIRITSETIDTGTGMSIGSHKLKAMRVSYGG